MKNEQKRTRELEIARQFKNVLNLLPVDFYDAVVSALINSEHPKHLSIDNERSIFLGSQDRADLICSFPVFRNIIFEFKLGDENVEQIIRYSTYMPDAKIVSISKNSKFTEIDQEKYYNISSFEWQDLLNGFLPIISPEMKERLKPLTSDTSFSPNFPERRLGDPTLFVLENFLSLLKEEGLVVTKGERVLVVTGGMASKSTTLHNVYWFGKNWSRDFQFLVVVYKKEFLYVGEVIERNFDKSTINEFNTKYQNIIELAFDESPNVFNGQPVIVLKDLRDNEKFKSRIGKPYARSGAITQSHRYFDNLVSFFKHFSNGE
jgi:hypothetical protein